MTGYAVTYTFDANEDVIAEIRRLLLNSGAGQITHEPLNRRFLTQPDSGTATTNPDQIKRQLARVSHAVVAVTPYQPTVQDVTNWNMAFTNLIRETSGAAWGNWDFNTLIRAGVVGILDPDTGNFTRVAELQDANIIDNVAYQAWSLETESTQFSQSEVQFEGGYKDPSSGEEVNVGLDATWSFGSENSMVSRATVSGRESVDNFGVLLKSEATWKWLLAQAEGVGYTNPEGIVQGFGVITAVTNCIGALNIAANEADSAFSLVGSVDGIAAMTGGGNAQAGVKGSYKEKKQSKSFNSHTWPVAHNSTAPGTGEVALYYQFTTFHGTQVLPTWIQRVGNFAITFDNSHGGTYIGRCYVTYSVPLLGERIGQDERVEKYVRVSGGEVGTISGIPLNAFNLNIHVDFNSGGHHYFDIASPATHWLKGTCTVDLGGVWPWGSRANIRPN
jgi:hypothetical protein